MSADILEYSIKSAFNLSILECKYRTLIPVFAKLNLLIYPYWNVNTGATFYIPILGYLLIYPYWNVNLSIAI